MFVILREILKKTQTAEEHLRALKEIGKTDKVKLSFKYSDAIEGTLKLDTLGTIDKRHFPTDIKMKQSKKKQTQFVPQTIKWLSIDDIKPRYTSLFQFPCADLTGLSKLPDGSILICDYGTLENIRNPIAFVDDDGDSVSNISVPGKYVFDVAVIDQTTVAVTSGKDKTVSILDIPSSSIKRSTTTDNDCHGITYYNHHLYCCVRGEGIVKISIKTVQTSAFYRTDLSDFSFITYHDKKIYFTNRLEYSVTCCDLHGSEIWKFEDSLAMKSPRGIAVGKFSYIYIADYLSDTFVQLSEDGKNSRKIYTKDDGMNKPKAVFYDTERHRLLVGTENGRVHFYNVDLCV